MGDSKMTLGQAIDKIVEALEPLDPDARRTAVQAACSHLGVTLGDVGGGNAGRLPQEQAAPPPPQTPSPPAGPATPARPATDIRALKEQKQPSSSTQMACIVAYYLQELAPPAERKDTIRTSDLEKYFKQAGYRLPRVLDQVLIDAKASGYFESVSRGEYRLNTVGYNLVVHNLPKQKVG